MRSSARDVFADEDKAGMCGMCVPRQKLIVQPARLSARSEELEEEKV